MDTILNSEVFFFVSAVGFIFLGILTAVLLFYLIRIGRTLERIVDRAEDDIDKIGDTTKEILEDMRESTLFNFIFHKKRRKDAKN